MNDQGTKKHVIGDVAVRPRERAELLTQLDLLASSIAAGDTSCVADARCLLIRLVVDTLARTPKDEIVSFIEYRTIDIDV